MVLSTEYENGRVFFVDITVSSHDEYKFDSTNDTTIVYNIGNESYTRSRIQSILENIGFFKIDFYRYVEYYSEQKDRDGDLIITMSGPIDITNRDYDITNRDYDIECQTEFSSPKSTFDRFDIDITNRDYDITNRDYDITNRDYDITNRDYDAETFDAYDDLDIVVNDDGNEEVLEIPVAREKSAREICV